MTQNVNVSAEDAEAGEALSASKHVNVRRQQSIDHLFIMASVDVTSTQFNNTSLMWLFFLNETEDGKLKTKMPVNLQVFD